MAQDMEERLRRSLAARGGDVEPDPSTWEAVQSRIRRRAYARWTATGAVAVAALVLAALVLPGLLTGSRVDLTPADPPDAGTPLSASGLVTTDGRTIVATDAAGEVVAEITPPSDAAEPLPVARLAVRPGSTPDDFSLVYTRADAGCEDVEVHWMTVDEEGTSSGFYGGGPGYCITDPVWSPNGSVVGWIRQRSTDDQSEQTGVSLASATTSGDRYELHLRGWHGGAPEPFEPMGDNEWSPLDLTSLEDGQTPVRTLRATDWVETDVPGLEMDGRVGPGSMLRLSASHDGGVVQAARLGPIRQHAESGHSLELGSTDVEPEVLPDARPLVSVGGHEGDGTPAEPTYSLVLLTTGDVGLHRATGDDVQTLSLPGDVLDADQAATGDAWLSASGDTVVLGVAGDAWAVRWDGDGWSDLDALPGVVSADLMALPDAPPEPSPEPADFPFVSTDGGTLTVHGLDGPFALAEAQEGDILDFAIHPASTTDGLTVVWREGRGCAATLHYLRAVGSAGTAEMDTTVGEALPATCPGRPTFAPDGTHLAWMSQPDAGPEEPASEDVRLETLAWADGPADGPVPFAVQLEQPETASFDLTDWIWTEDTATAAAGMLHLVGYTSHGTPAAHTVPIERRDDGALALPAGTAPEEQRAILQVDAHVGDPASGTVGPSFALESVPGADVNALQVVRHAGEGTDEFPLPEGLLTVYGGAAETDDVWMTARSNDVLLGDGAGQAWRLPWTDAGWADLQELGGEIRYAASLQPPAVEDRTPDGEPADGLPAAVADTRAAILDAARAGDVDALAELAGEEFTSSFGGPEGPHGFFTRLRDEGELDRLARILELPYGEEGGVYSWPFAFTRDLETLSSAELESLGEIASQEEIDSWFAFGGYAGWRAGIDADGTWRFYVAGD